MFLRNVCLLSAPAPSPASGFRVLSLAAVLLLSFLSLACGSGRTLDADAGAPAPVGEWHHYAADRASTKYSPLDQINPSNVDRLREVWRWTSVETEADTEFRGGMYKSTPLYIDGTLYITTSLSQVAAIDPGTGETRWVYDPRSYDAGRPANAGFQQRGLEYWRGEIDGEAVERLIYAAHHRRLISLDRGDRPARPGLRRRRHGEHRPRPGPRDQRAPVHPLGAADGLRRRHRAGLGHLGRSARTEDAARPRPRLRRADRGDALDLSHDSAARRVRQ